LEELQKNIESSEVIVQIQKEELNLQCNYQNVLRREEGYWRLKSRSLWLQARDKNTIKFHNQTKFKQLQNNVSKIILVDENIVTDFAEIKNAERLHFETCTCKEKKPPNPTSQPCLTIFHPKYVMKKILISIDTSLKLKST